MADDDWENEAKTGEVKSEAPKAGGFGSGGSGGFGSGAASTGFGGSSGFGGQSFEFIFY
jgi:hypothetical protein